MALRIRLSRGGAKKRPFYRIIVADARSPRDGKFIEVLGTYNPVLAADHPDRVTLKSERIQHWLQHGATPSDRVARFCASAGLMRIAGAAGAGAQAAAEKEGAGADEGATGGGGRLSGLARQP